jgi:hypothetical protein
MFDWPLTPPKQLTLLLSLLLAILPVWFIG